MTEYNLFDFDLEGYKELITQTDIGGGFASLDTEHHE